MKTLTIKVLFYLIFLVIIPCSLHAQEQESPNKSESAAEAAIIPLIDANFEIERTYKMFYKLDALLVPDKEIEQIENNFRQFSGRIEKEAADFQSFVPNNFSKYFLESSYRLWSGFYLKLELWKIAVNKRIQGTQNQIDVLDGIIKKWESTLSHKSYEVVPNDLRIRIAELIEKAKVYRSKFQLLKRDYLVLEDDMTDLIAFSNEIRLEIDKQQSNRRDSLLIASEPNLFQVNIGPNDTNNFGGRWKKAWTEMRKTIVNYFSNKSLTLYLVVVGLFLLSFFWIRKRYLELDVDNSEPGHQTIFRIFKGHPLLTAITMTLVFFHLLFPFYPLILNHLITLILLVNMFFILKRFIDKETRSFIFRLVILLALNDLEVFAWYFGNVTRHYVLLESILGIVLAFPYMRRYQWLRFSELGYIRQTRLLLASTIFVFYTIAFFANLTGYYDLSVLMLAVGIHVPEFTVLLFGLYLITMAIFHAAIKYFRQQQPEKYHPGFDKAEQKVVSILKFLAVVYWFFSLSVSFEVERLVFSSFSDFLEKERVFGDITITYGRVLSFILILVITYLFTSLLKWLIERTLKKTDLPKGVPTAISLTIKYFILGLGFLLALSTAGIDLGKFGFIAGALGVGIGFGLQNIVHNFISGLIMIYERPLQVGDTIEVENLLGTVNRIGIRSSNVRTFDGAEVVVPNGNLVSNQLINWTLSDNIRRVEVKVGAAYGTDPNLVISLLSKAAHANPNVLNEPLPMALFEGFGESSLDFRLLFWVPYELGLTTKSEVALAVYNIFKENNIVIPFPQMDVYLRRTTSED